jgi:hypothetical protein
MSTIRTRPRTRAKRERKKKIYDVRPYLRGGISRRYSHEGRSVVEQTPKNIYLPMINPAGHLVYAPLQTDPNNRDYNHPESRRAREELEINGFIAAHECPIANRALHPEDEKALFGDRPETDEGHDYGWEPNKPFRRVRLCKNLQKILDVRRAENDKKEQDAAERAMSAWAQQAKLSAESNELMREVIAASQKPKSAAKSKGG